jgi:hypothetical protein
MACQRRLFSRRHYGAADEDGEKRRQDKGGYYGKTVGREQGTVGDDRGACRHEQEAQIVDELRSDTGELFGRATAQIEIPEQKQHSAKRTREGDAE